MHPKTVEKHRTIGIKNNNLRHYNNCIKKYKKTKDFGKLYYGIKALSLKEKMVLFALYKEKK